MCAEEVCITEPHSHDSVPNNHRVVAVGPERMVNGREGTGRDREQVVGAVLPQSPHHRRMGAWPDARAHLRSELHCGLHLLPHPHLDSWCQPMVLVS